MDEQNRNRDFENQEGKDFQERTGNSQYVDQDVSKSEKEDASISKEEVKAVDVEKEDASKEAKNLEAEVSVTDEPTEAQFSCSYEPPYEAPIFASEPSEAGKKTKIKKNPKALLAILIAAGILLAFVGGALLGPYFFDQENSFPMPSGSNSEEKKVYESFAELVEAVADSVVDIDVTVSNGQVFGSGVIVDAAGYIITNEHVVEQYSSILVRLRNGTEYAAEYFAGDSKYDIAVLKITPEAQDTLTVASIGKTEDIKVGEEVIAIGNPLGKLGGTVTNGIISAKNRKIRTDFYPMTFLQTNAQISQGNSGGALFNMSGELIGIVNAKVIDSSAGAEGLGFAIPIDVAWRCAQDLMEHGYVTGEPSLGFSIAHGTPGFGYPIGIYVVSSENVLLKKYDRIQMINGKTVTSMEDVYQVTDRMEIGDEIEFQVIRSGVSGSISVVVTVEEYRP